MRRRIIGCGFFAFACCIALAQAPEGNSAFEVASVKLSTGVPLGPDGTDGGPGTRYPERFAADATLRIFLFGAYGLDDFQQQISGPGWIDTQKYAIDARMLPGTSKAQFQEMLRNLLAERFKLAVHHESIVLPVYNLVIGKNGSKLKESAGNPNVASVQPVAGPDRDGFPVLPAGQPGLATSFAGPVARWRAQQQPVSAFARMLGNPGNAGRNPGNAGRVVIDKTGLTGKYDFTLHYDLAAHTPGLTIFDAVEQQLGLKLVDGKASFDKIVIDHAEKVPAD